MASESKPAIVIADVSSEHEPPCLNNSASRPPDKDPGTAIDLQETSMQYEEPMLSHRSHESGCSTTSLFNRCTMCSGDTTDGWLIRMPCACQRAVHAECLAQWILSSQKQANQEVERLTCEVCRQPYREITARKKFRCKADRRFTRDFVRIGLLIVVASILMAWGIQSVVSSSGDGLGANLFLPLALAMLCVGCLNCGEVMYLYRLKHTKETLCYKGFPMSKDQPEVMVTELNASDPAEPILPVDSSVGANTDYGSTNYLDDAHQDDDSEEATDDSAVTPHQFFSNPFSFLHLTTSSVQR